MRGPPNFDERKKARSTKSAPPRTASRRLARVLDPTRSVIVRASCLSTQKEKTMITLYDHIQELRAELRGCIMTRAERVELNAELTKAIAEQTEIDQAFDETFEAHFEEGG
jgi:hypothetical protein